MSGEPDGVNYIAQVSPARFARGHYVVTQRAGPPMRYFITTICKG
jgi:hypothetical protein